jgi:hypothetical protein
MLAVPAEDETALLQSRWIEFVEVQAFWLESVELDSHSEWVVVTVQLEARKLDLHHFASFICKGIIVLDYPNSLLQMLESQNNSCRCLLKI